MNLIKRRLRFMLAAEQPYYKPFRYRGDDFKREDAIVEYDVTFDVNAEMTSGGMADFSLPEMKESADALIKILGAQIRNMNDASFQKEITDTVTSVAVQNISDNVFKAMPEKFRNKNIFNRTSALLSLVDESSIYNNEMKVHFKLELVTGTVTEELVEALDKAYNNTKSHCCSQIAKRLTDLYDWEKQNGKGLEAIKTVKIEYKSYSGFKLEPKVEEVKVKEDEIDDLFDDGLTQKERDAIQKVQDKIEWNRNKYMSYPQPRQIITWCKNEGVDPSYFIPNYKG